MSKVDLTLLKELQAGVDEHSLKTLQELSAPANQEERILGQMTKAVRQKFYTASGGGEAELLALFNELIDSMDDE